MTRSPAGSSTGGFDGLGRAATTRVHAILHRAMHRAADGIRTRDLHVGNVSRYQLRHDGMGARDSENLASRLGPEDGPPGAAWACTVTEFPGPRAFRRTQVPGLDREAPERRATLRADDGNRTRGLHLGRVTRCLLRHVRASDVRRDSNPHCGLGMTAPASACATHITASPNPASNRAPPPYHGGALPNELSGQWREFFRPRDVPLPPGAYVPGAGIEPACARTKAWPGCLQPTPDQGADDRTRTCMFTAYRAVPLAI